MYNKNPQLCMYCEDPSKIVQTIKKPYWPFAVDRIDSYCYECYQEIVKGQIPRVTDSSLSSKRGRGIKKRQRYMD
jgi:hypothetical protein